jgi:glycosyltransferase involved in cell wall biosynthesis
LIDILVPTYEPKPKHLTAALDSLLAQTEKRWRVFIHDDASQADAAAIVEPYLSDPRFRFKKSSVRLGIGGNWNACLKEATAPYVLYLFQDDLWEPELLKRSLEVLEKHPSVGFVTVDHRYLCEGVDPEIAARYKELEEYRRQYAGEGPHEGKATLREWMGRGLHPNLIGEPSFVMIRRSVMEKAGLFDETMPQSLDAEYWVRLLPLCDWFFLDEILGSFRVHPSGTSEKNRREGKGLFDRFICMERVLEHAEGSEKKAMNRAFLAHFEGMIRKYLDRKKEGGAVSGEGSGAVKAFAMRHPLLFGRAFLGAIAKKG